MRIGWIQTKWVEMSGLVATSFKPLITLSSVNYERGKTCLAPNQHKKDHLASVKPCHGKKLKSFKNLNALKSKNI